MDTRRILKKWHAVIVIGAILGAPPAVRGAAVPILPHQTCQLIDCYPHDVMIALDLACWKDSLYLSGQGISGKGPSLFKFDVTNPYDMLYVSSGDGSGIKGYDVMVVDDRLYDANWGTVLRIYDLCGTDPPKQMGEYNQAPYFGWNVDVLASRAYVSCSYESVSSTNFIFDVSNPVRPVLKSTLPNNMGRLGGSPRARGSFYYYVNENHFCVANVSDITDPRKVVDIGHDYRLAGVRLRGDYALVYWSQDGGGGIYVYDVSDPPNPTKVGQWPAQPPGPPPPASEVGTGLNDMTLLGDLAICATGGNGVLTFSIADPTNPWPVDQPNSYAWGEMATAANGCYAYVALYRHVPDDRGALWSMKVYSEDPDDAGPGKWSAFSLQDGSWDTDYECDTVPADAPQPWKLLEGTASLATSSDGVLVIDDNRSDAKVKWVRNWDACNTEGATVAFRAKCASYDTSGGSLDTLSNVYIEDGRFKEDFAVLSDRIRAQYSGQEVALDGTQWRIYRITTQGNEFKVYVDEAPVPVMTGTLSQPTQRSRVTFGSGSTLCRQHVFFDYIELASGGVFGPSAKTADQTPDLSVSVADTAGRDSLSGIDGSTAAVHYSRDGGLTWITGGCPVTFTAAGCGTPANRGIVRAYGVPFNSDSHTDNKIRFSISDNAGNVGHSPVYNVRVDPSAIPTVVNVTSNAANGLYRQGNAINIQVTFSAPVWVTGNPQMKLAVTPAGRWVNYVSGSGTAVLNFAYTVGADEATSDLTYVASTPLFLNAGSIKEQFGSDADLRLPEPGAPGSLSHNKDIAIDSVRPVVVNVGSDTPDGSYNAGDAVDVTVAFSEPVNVTGTPLLELETGSVDRKASYLSGSGSSTLVFRYTVQEADASADLDCRATNSLTGTIKDIAGNFGNLTLPAPAAPASLGYNKNIVIDNIAPAPAAPGVPSLPVTRDCAVSLAIVFSEPVVGFDSPADVEVTATGDAAAALISIEGAGVGPYTVTLSGFAGDGTLTIGVPAGACTDAAGNANTAGPVGPAFAVVGAAGSISVARTLAPGARVALAGKVLYLRQGDFAYIQEPDRSSGIRIEGTIPANAGDVITLTGTVQISAGGEPCILVDALSSCQSGEVKPLGGSNAWVRSGMLDGILVKTWGTVASQPAGNSFAISDGSPGPGLVVVCADAPDVGEGDFVAVTGAAGFSGQRVIYCGQAGVRIWRPANSSP